MSNLTESQQAALVALFDTETPITDFHTATELGVSGKTLASLVKRGLVKSNTDWSSRYLGLPTGYTLTNSGLLHVEYLTAP